MRRRKSACSCSLILRLSSSRAWTRTPDELAGDGAQQADLVGGELAAAQRLHDQHAERRAPLEHGHAEERVVALLVRLGEELEARVHRRVGYRDRLHGLDDEAGQALADQHAHAADRAVLEAGGRPQRERRRALVEQVDRARLGTHALGDHLDDAVERLLQVLGLADQGADVLEEAQAVT